MHLGFRLATASLISIATVTTYAQQKAARPISDRDRLVGTWHLSAIDSPTPDGSPQPPKPTGLTVYTPDGFEAVQLMYPKAAASLNNEFVHDGYEASYGSFQIDESKHLLKFHVLSANTRDHLVGTEELRMYSFPDARHLVMRPADPKQHWSVTWEKR